MNKNEAAYAEHLQRKLQTGQILRWDFEPETFVLGHNCRYTPDFRVVLPDGTVEFHDAKGCKMVKRTDGKMEPTAWMEEDARVKLRAASGLHPYGFYVVYQSPAKYGGGWTIEEM